MPPFNATFFMIKELITATLVATAPMTINNTQAYTTRTINNTIYSMQDGSNLTQAVINANRYLFRDNQTTINLNLLQYKQNNYIECKQTYFNNEYMCRIDMLNIQYVYAPADQTPYDVLWTKLRKSWYLPYDTQYLYGAYHYVAYIEPANLTNESWDYIDTFLELQTLPTWTRYTQQNYANNIYNIVNNDTDKFDTYELTQQDAINYFEDTTIAGIAPSFSSNNGQEQICIVYDYILYNFGQDEPTIINYLAGNFNPVEIELNWTVPDNPYQNEIVDIPGLLLTIIGMPFAFISQAFDLTIFPNTPYAVNLSHIFLALICAGIMIFIIKKVVK